VPLAIEIFHDRKFVRIVASGAVTLREMEEHFDTLVVANALPYAKLFDASMLRPVYDDHDALMMGARLSAYTDHYDSGPLAVVGRASDVREAFARFVNLSPSTRLAAFFASEEEALKWLQAQGTVARGARRGRWE
jgi:hypothetical protein